MVSLQNIAAMEAPRYLGLPDENALLAIDQ
jgi:hypothetical protein